MEGKLQFEDNLDLLAKSSFYLIRANSLPDFVANNFSVTLGNEGRMYKGDGKCLNSALANAMKAFKANVTWPSGRQADAGVGFFDELGLGD